LFADHFSHFVAPHLRHVRENWDNMSRDKAISNYTINDDIAERSEEVVNNSIEEGSTERSNAYTSWETCQFTCKSTEPCLQWKWKPGLCQLSWVIRLGKAYESKTDDKAVVSGWILNKIHHYQASMECDRNAHWPTDIPEPFSETKDKPSEESMQVE
jgi:hypothetical protein